MFITMKQSRVPGSERSLDCIRNLPAVQNENYKLETGSSVQNTCSKTNERADCMQLNKLSRKRQNIPQ